MFKKIHFIINPSSGKEEPVLSYIDKILKDSEIEWDVAVTQKHDDAKEFAEKAKSMGFDAVVVYGGDGTVVQVAQALMHSELPMIILPGGTANVMAKELMMPIDTVASLQLIKDGKLEKRVIDMAICNETPILIRVNVGFVADMVSNVDPGLKEMFGQLAYGVTAVQHMMQSPTNKYILTLDGEEREVEGAAVVVANVCNVGVPGVSFVPGSAISDGKLDVLVMHSTDLPSVMKAIGTMVSQQVPEDVYSHWQVSEASVKLLASQSILCDDYPIETMEIHTKIVPRSLWVYAPITGNTQTN